MGDFLKVNFPARNIRAKAIFSNKTRERLVLQDKAQNEELADKDVIVLLLNSWSRIWEVSDTQCQNFRLQIPAEPQKVLNPN